jgi:hypothetical protein
VELSGIEPLTSAARRHALDPTKTHLLFSQWS